MILIIFFDGLRPDQVTEESTPNLLRLSRRGVSFDNHHAAFPTHTRVNVASLVTGCYPERHGLMNNRFFLPEVDPSWRIDSGNHEDLRRLDARVDGELLMSSTLGEVLHGAGHTLAAIGVGTSGNAFLQNHKASSIPGTVIHPDFVLGDSRVSAFLERFGPWPETGLPNKARAERAVKVLLEYLIPQYSPSVACLWISDPDSTQHSTAVNSPEASEGIRWNDGQLGRILDHLERSGLADSTDVLVASDHGHSTVVGTVDVSGILVEAGLKAGRDSTDVLVADNGGCESIYVPDRDGDKVRAIVELLMAQPWCGPIFTRDASGPVPGTLPMSLIHNDNERSSDILFSFGWDSSVNPYGFPGGVFSAGGRVGIGMHGSLSPYEVRSMLVAAGPHFKESMRSTVPSGIVDLFPTVLHILGVEPPGPVDGRVLHEALDGGPDPREIFVETTVHRASASVNNANYHQEVQVSRVGDTVYVDKGRAGLEA
ncbi:MAG: alkaline phosphatase family protein [Dehalococcoidia bacterium]